MLLEAYQTQFPTVLRLRNLVGHVAQSDKVFRPPHKMWSWAGVAVESLGKQRRLEPR
jgi:hypothetical protein